MIVISLICATCQSLIPDGRVHGGIYAVDGQFPFVVQVQSRENIDGYYYSSWGTGVIFSSRMVITAAHVLEKE